DTNALRQKTCCYRSHAAVKDRLSYAAEQRRKLSIVIPSSPSTDLQGIAVAYAAISEVSRKAKPWRTRHLAHLDLADCVLSVAPGVWRAEDGAGEAPEGP